MSTISKKQIIEESLSLFFKYGIKSVSMDDISISIGISKKTLYQLFNNKECLIESIIKGFINKQDIEIKNVLDEDVDVIDKILRIYSKILYHFKSCTPAFIYSLEKYYPEIFNLFVNFKKKQLLVIITYLLKQGRYEEIFRDDIDEKLIYELHVNRLNSIIYGLLLPDKRAGDPIYFEVLKITLRGITTVKGHKILDKKLMNQSIY